MLKEASSPQPRQADAAGRDPWADEAISDEFKPLTRQEAQQWRARQTDVSPWQVVGWQAVLLVLVTLASFVWARQASVVWSVFYGGLCIVLPTALMAYGLTSGLWARRLRTGQAGTASSSLAMVFFWEGIKILLALALMWMAPQVVPDLSWLGLVVGLVVVLKAYWLAFWMARRRVI